MKFSFKKLYADMIMNNKININFIKNKELKAKVKEELISRGAPKEKYEE